LNRDAAVDLLDRLHEARDGAVDYSDPAGCSVRAAELRKLPTKRTASTTGDGAFMEPSRRNQWQSAANRPTAKPVKTSEIRCRGLRPVAAAVKW
jgi:hypothetical protein